MGLRFANLEINMVAEPQPAVMKVIAPDGMQWKFKMPKSAKLIGLEIHLMEGVKPIAFLEYGDRLVPMERIEGDKENGRV